MTKQEWAAKYLMHLPAQRPTRKLLGKPPKPGPSPVPPTILSKDWRTTGKVTLVKDQARWAQRRPRHAASLFSEQQHYGIALLPIPNVTQGGCGSCWAFGQVSLRRGACPVGPAVVLRLHHRHVKSVQETPATA